MNSKIIHIKLPNDFFEGPDPFGCVQVIQQLQAKVEQHGEPGEYCCIATPFDIKCLNDKEAILTVSHILDTLLLEEHLKDGLKQILERILKELDDE